MTSRKGETKFNLGCFFFRACDFATVNNRVFSVGFGAHSLVEWDNTNSDMKKAEFKDFRKNSSGPVGMSVYQNILAVPDDKIIKFWQISDYSVIARVSEELTQRKAVLAVDFNKLGQLLAATLEGDSVVILTNTEAQTHFKVRYRDTTSFFGNFNEISKNRFQFH